MVYWSSVIPAVIKILGFPHPRCPLQFFHPCSPAGWSIQWSIQAVPLLSLLLSLLWRAGVGFRQTMNLCQSSKGDKAHINTFSAYLVAWLSYGWTSMQIRAWQVGRWGDQVQGGFVLGLSWNFMICSSSHHMPKTTGSNHQRGAPTPSGNWNVAARHPPGYEQCWCKGFKVDCGCMRSSRTCQRHALKEKRKLESKYHEITYPQVHTFPQSGLCLQKQQTIC